MTVLRQFLSILVCTLLHQSVYTLKCYHCDNSISAACGQDFKAYQFDAKSCEEVNGIQPKCGKQQQPPDKNGWVGVIRSCYNPGDLPGINETTGCHQYFHDKHNFSALYCFCDTAYCNAAPSGFYIAELWTLFLTISALVCQIM